MVIKDVGETIFEVKSEECEESSFSLEDFRVELEISSVEDSEDESVEVLAFWSDKSLTVELVETYELYAVSERDVLEVDKEFVSSPIDVAKLEEGSFGMELEINELEVIWISLEVSGTLFDVEASIKVESVLSKEELATSTKLVGWVLE